jgi:predicted O-linked N-acetylglucosamine transferase (SPINDLY family)
MKAGTPSLADAEGRIDIGMSAAASGAEEAEAVFRRALQLHQSGRLDEAEAGYRAVLALAPGHADTLHLLGVIHYQKGDSQAAAELIASALKLNPDNAPAHSNLGNALRRLGRAAEALAHYDRALELKPDYAEAFNNRGNALIDLSRPTEALASFDRALELRPVYAEAYKNRGLALKRLGQKEEALVSSDRAVSLAPADPSAWYNRATMLSDMGRLVEALASYDQALRLRPHYAEALNNRGEVLRRLKRSEEAIASFDAALNAKPDFADALNNRGNGLLDLGRAEAALGDYDRALRLKPDFAEAWNNRGDALRELQRAEESLASYDRALSLKPGIIEALDNRGMALLDLKRFAEAAEDLAHVLERTERDYTRGYMFHARLQACDWRDYGTLANRIAADVARGGRRDAPFSFLAHSTDPAVQLRCARTYADEKHPPQRTIWRGERYRHDKVRLAYLSSDFQNHPVSFLIAELIEIHDRARFEVCGLSLRPAREGEMRARIARAFDRFIDVGNKTDREVAALLREMEIDIAVDLNGFTQGYRTGIFACRGAPIQVNYLGYPGTMGAEYIDYIIADHHVVPKGHEPFYAEKIVRLPDTYQANDRKRRMAEQAPSRAELGLPDGFVFCCFNNNYKIAPFVFDIWMRLLSRTEGSVLWLLEDNPEAVRNLRREAANRGVSPERIVFAPRVAPADHLARFTKADLFLDTLPYNAHTTASEALWAGLPLVTCPGKTFASRVAASLLHAMGLPELVAADLEAYERLALELATTPELMSGLRMKLARNRDRAPLFDTDRFRRHIEAAFLTMHRRHEERLPAASFEVSSTA